MASKKGILIGVAILSVAVIFVLTLILVPLAAQKKELNSILQKLSANDVAFLAVGDPLYDNGDVLGNGGKEIVLENAEAEQLRALIAALADSGCCKIAEQKLIGGTWDQHIKVRTAQGEVVYLWCTAQDLYYRKGNACIRFAAKDATAYANLWQKMQEILAQ